MFEMCVGSAELAALFFFTKIQSGGTTMDYLHEGLERLGYTAEEYPQLEENLRIYAHELEEANKKFDLVGADTHDDVIIRHILDSMSAGKIIEGLYRERQAVSENASIADIGSGGGLPGIPLSLSMPSIPFNLVERMSKRCAFLESCTSVLQMSNTTIHNLEVERVPQESFDVIVFRAFRPLDKKMTKSLLRILKHGGYLAAYKAKPEKIAEEMEGIKAQVPEYKMVPLEVPFLTDGGAYSRNLVIVQRK